MDIVTLGELLIDMFPAELGRALADVSAFYPKPGGAPANVAIAARRLGAQTAFIGKVGDDFFGYHLRDVLRREGVDTRGLRFDSETRTTMAMIAMPDENTAEFVFYRNPGADTRLTPAELDTDLLQATRVFHFGSLSLTDEPARSATLAAIEIARQSGALVSFDVNYRPSLWIGPAEAALRIRAVMPYVDVLKVNEAELELLTGARDPEAGSQTLLEAGPSLVLATLGQDGSTFRSRQGSGHVPSYEVETLDATGCGDAFIAGVLTRLAFSRENWLHQLAPDSLRRIVRYGNAAGALTALKRGVIPALPTAKQVEAFLDVGPLDEAEAGA